MDDEGIYLEGGPADGETRWWKGGDWLEVAEVPPVSFKETEGPLNAKVSFRSHSYQRTDRDRGGYVVFEYRPSPA